MTDRTLTPGQTGNTRQLAFLRTAVGILAIGLIVLATWVIRLSGELSEFSTSELTVERLNIVEADGQPAFVLANSTRAPMPTIEGQTIKSAGARNSPAFIFFDGKGDEVGGLLLINEGDENGYRSVRHLSFDQFGQDQTLVLHHYEQDGRAETGLRIDSRPFDIGLLETLDELELEPSASREELMEAIGSLDEERRKQLFGAGTRAYFGSDFAETAMVSLSDGMGRPRLRMAVTEAGEAYLEFLDERGRVTTRIPEPDEASGEGGENESADTINLSADEINRLLGDYEISPGQGLTIATRDDRIVAKVPGQPAVDLEAIAADKLINRQFGLEITFGYEGDQPATELVFYEGGQKISAKRVEADD